MSAADGSRSGSNAGPADDASWHRALLWGVAGAIFIALWVWPVQSSLWTDELVTAWVTDGGLGDTISRSFRFQHSPVYFVVVWLARSTFGDAELVLRLPSLIGGVGAVLVFRRLLRYLVDDETSRLGTVTFVALGILAFVMSDARPYGIGVFLIVCSTFALVRWCDDPGSTRWPVVFVLASVAALWLHFTLGSILVVQALYLVAKFRVDRQTLPLGRLAVVVSLICLGVAPLILPTAGLWARRDELAASNVATPRDVFLAVVPVALVAGALVGLVLARMLGPVSLRRPHLVVATSVLLVGWALLPPIMLFVASVVLDSMLLTPRYAVCAGPGAAALLAIGIGSVHPNLARRIVVLCIAIAAVLAAGGSLKNGEDWRGAAALARRHVGGGAVVLQPALIESTQADRFEDELDRSYLAAPAAYYAFGGPVLVLPYTPSDETSAYLDTVLADLARRDRFVLISNEPRAGYEGLLAERLGGAWTRARLPLDGAIEVVVFTKASVER